MSAVRIWGKTGSGPGKPTLWARFLCWVHAFRFFWLKFLIGRKRALLFLLRNSARGSFVGAHGIFFKKCKTVSNLQKTFSTNYMFSSGAIWGYVDMLFHCSWILQCISCNKDFLLLGRNTPIAPNRVVNTMRHCCSSLTNLPMIPLS